MQTVFHSIFPAFIFFIFFLDSLFPFFSISFPFRILSFHLYDFLRSSPFFPFVFLSRFTILSAYSMLLVSYTKRVDLLRGVRDHGEGYSRQKKILKLSSSSSLCVSADRSWRVGDIGTDRYIAWVCVRYTAVH